MQSGGRLTLLNVGLPKLGTVDYLSDEVESHVVDHVVIHLFSILTHMELLVYGLPWFYGGICFFMNLGFFYTFLRS